MIERDERFEIYHTCGICGAAWWIPRNTVFFTKSRYWSRNKYMHTKPCLCCGCISPPLIKFRVYRNHNLIPECSTKASDDTTRGKAAVAIAQRALNVARRMPGGGAVTLRSLLVNIVPAGYGKLREIGSSGSVYMALFFGYKMPCVGVVTRDESDMIIKKAVSSATSMLQIRLPEDTHRWLKSYCARNGMTMKGLLVAYVNHLRALEEGSSMVKPL